ncbi:asparagine synthase (glutamine-hydrolysing) [Frankia torreyi]|uniref:Asparagine synthase (Glutamine-hydrolysing) n=2 Tax=Frankia TaxID=1854 RepID=A0A0D8BI18_9ACTN|nr:MULTISPECIES: asparagine synthase-related protein [Frankia]KJE23893.1 asparagine synthase (glutamine-hydrolysing) [Frankia torreyi]KQC40065.1 asparagine synthase [Frankia sp. ACN1ag]
MTTPITARRPGHDARLASPRPSCWFVALSDRDPVVLPAAVRRVLRYPSGRPWLVGDWPDDAMVSAATHRARIALVGRVEANSSQLLRLLMAARDVHSLDVARAVAGDYHVIAEINGQCRLQGSPTGTRRIFTALSGGQHVAADRADVLAELAGSELDRTALALSLLDPFPPYPLDDLVPWESVETVPPDHYLFLDRDGRVERMRWWRQPASVRSRAEGAPILRAALAEAVSVRVAAGRTVSADLSGGLASTAVCCLAARGPADIVAVTRIAQDPDGNDARWSADAAVSLPGVAREILPASELPLVFDGIASADEALDRPFVGLVDRARMRAGLDRVALYGPRLHLTGFGGEQVAQGAPNYLSRLARRRPWTTLQHLRGFRAREGWPWAASLRMMRRRDYRDCLFDLARALDQAPLGGGPARPESPHAAAALDWTLPPIVPGWLTRAALRLIAEAVADVARRDAPLAPTRDGHADLFAIRAAASAFRLFDQMASPVGPPLSAPFLDDRVVRAALAVRAEERASPWENEPLLKEAMRQVVPANCLLQKISGGADAEQGRGLPANRGVLVGLCEDSPLADLGLIEPEALREACRQGAATDRRLQALRPTFAADAWLRTLAGRCG